MGGAVSAGDDNDELIDNLLEADYIKSSAVEQVFRAVDRGHYFTLEYKERAYRDIAWKCGNLHISAPCIYSKVMENLKLAPGLSFLNLGSGTGYLSTMAGLILGPYGINHGIEIHEDVLNYASKKLQEFVLSSTAVDEYEFCEPKFVCGNCLNLDTGTRQYDRVYCSAACPENHESYMKNLIKVGGILVIPINDQLLQICRTSDTNWESKSVLPVSFATLVSGRIAEGQEPLKLPDADPLSLQDLCRYVVRSILRQSIDAEHPELKKPNRVPKKKAKKRTLRGYVIPVFHSNSDDEDYIAEIQASRSIIGWSEILRGSSSTNVNNTESRGTSENSSYNQEENETAMDEDPNTVPEVGLNHSSDDELMNYEIFETDTSDFEELHNYWTTATISESESENRRPELSFDTEMEFKPNYKRKTEIKFENIEEEDEEESDSEKKEGKKNISKNEGQCKNYPFLKITRSDVDAEGCKKADKKVLQGKGDPPDPPVPSDPSPPVSIVNYTTCMKEKIKLLPLPMTLKYFLNLNREL